MMKLNSVRLRLLVWNISVLAIVLFAFLLCAHILIRARLISSLDHRLSGAAGREAFFVANADKFPPPPPPLRRGHDNHFLQSMRQNKERFQRGVRYFNMKAEPLFQHKNTEDNDVKPWDRHAVHQTILAKSPRYSMSQDGDRVPLRVFTRLVYRDGKPLGVIQVAMSYAEVQAVLEGLTTLLLLLVPCALVVAAMGGIFLTDRALRPVRQIITSAENLKPDDLSQRLPVVGADEFAHLSTTINRMLQRIEEAFCQLKDALDRERRFTSDASHELRTPLTAIKANATLALSDDATPEDYRESLQAINTAATSMHRLVNDLLLLARSDSGQLAVVHEPVNIHDLFLGASSMVGYRDDQATINIEELGEKDTVLGDAHQLQRLLVNLLENALHYTPKDGTITLSAQRQGDTIKLTVADTGEGIPPEHLPHLCERFYRVDPSRTRRQGGTGLGLAICRSIVEAHNGTLTIDSTPHVGTTVTVTLPSDDQQ
ncbi:MAG TPA: ATP-binding protein [Armatimonadota bacterium]|nr:ATP-binding protein [Armatimonadota bacterium]